MASCICLSFTNPNFLAVMELDKIGLIILVMILEIILYNILPKGHWLEITKIIWMIKLKNEYKKCITKSVMGSKNCFLPPP